MSGHDSDNLYVIRFPEKFWEALLATGYAKNNLGARTFKALEAAQRGSSGGGYARYVINDHATLDRILTMLRLLVADARAKNLSARPFGKSKNDMDRYAHQIPRRRTLVRIAPIAEDTP